MGASELPPDEEASSPSSPATKHPSEASWIRRRLVGTGGLRAPTTRFTAGQAAYVLGFHGVGSFVISGGVNFGIACGESSFLSLKSSCVFHLIFHTTFVLVNLCRTFSLFRHTGP